MKRIADFKPYTGVLPYASEIFGIYQPLIGWTSKRQAERMNRGFAEDLAKARRGLLQRLTPLMDLDLVREGRLLEVSSVAPAGFTATRPRSTSTLLGDLVASLLPPGDRLDDAAWDVIDERRLADMLKSEVAPRVQAWAQEQEAERHHSERITAAAQQLGLESAMAGLLVHLKQTKQFDALRELFFKDDSDLQKLQAFATSRNPLDVIDPTKEIDRAVLSPIGIVHLFRQYFFEFDTFLGTPVGHVWLSPGSMVELIEVSTRRSLVEKTLEQSLETTLKTEKSRTEEDELSESVKEENRSDTKFGMNATVNQGWITGSATASTSLNLDSTQSKARETSHRHMRQQTEKISTEIRRSVKSTFRTVTETTDTSSKRYVLKNDTDKLINYELRRKMRQVGVQVQDIGTYLCWQAFVDDPGKNLGIAKLVHIAKDPELGAIVPPESVPRPGLHSTQVTIDIPFVPATKDTEPDEDMDEAYRDGVEVNTDTNEGNPERVKWEFSGFRSACDIASYEFRDVEFDYGGQDVRLELGAVDTSMPGEVGFDIKVRHINFRNNPNVRVTAKVNWGPSKKLVDEADAKNLAAVSKFNAETKSAYEKAFIDAARERINQASRVEQRPFEELREEERIVVYRALVQDMLTKGVPMPDDRTRHVVSELLNTIFDIDKMLYFVAPEWWRPRLHQSRQALGKVPKPPIIQTGAGGASSGSGAGAVHRSLKAKLMVNKISGSTVSQLAKQAQQEDTSLPATQVVSWGGVGENRADNYYITNESAPARLGASLGWMLQLDGDNMRNAFLNAPWVKAVIPIRPGQERAAINWLRSTHVEGADGLDAAYVAPVGELAEIPRIGAAPTVLEAIHHLCDKVTAKHKGSTEVQEFPPAGIDDDNRVAATPVDKVFEHGFYPLQGGFKLRTGADAFEVFDQWTEILPTDQVVPVEVVYDPKTGRQK
jgi:hypothetical protein